MSDELKVGRKEVDTQLRIFAALQRALDAGTLPTFPPKTPISPAAVEAARLIWNRLKDRGVTPYEEASVQLIVQAAIDVSNTESKAVRAAVKERGEDAKAVELLKVAVCPACDGSGATQVPVGEHFVSHEMAIDAGDSSMEGQSMGVEYEVQQCQWCDERKQLLDAAMQQQPGGKS